MKIHNKYKRIAVSTLSGLAAGSLAAAGVTVCFAATPLSSAIRFFAAAAAFAVTSNIASEIVEEELKPQDHEHQEK